MSDEFAKLLSIIERTPSEILERDFLNTLPNNCRDKNARDVLIHLYEWHKMLERFIGNNLEASKAGFKDRFSAKSEIMPFLPPPYNWRTYPALNMKIWQSHQSTRLKSALKKLKQGHSADCKTNIRF
ncbi:ClbS/DfsB family four-helix bundle protein [Helicobacter sp. T3_23-1059]